ncbi:tetratricopeptide repeat protein [Algicella marina]|uniref:Tetratricopeptide repeat protein n=1 Tax=Algicella marina TaxID=2683284 RepID=A0A6P1T2R1_9RHOB|nr:tetratricopeptide repeat protein [Algicella marina]QHQ36035.1 tetratricopeptide repeat protein [Algicella marina]
MTFAKISGLAAVFATTATIAFAAGSDDTTPPKPTATTTQCTSAQVFDPKTRKCVDARESNLSDDQRYEAARELAYDGQYENALIVLAAAEDQNDPRILNYKGFANRKAGRMDVGMSYYRAALDRNPDYVLVRSYMGQAFIQQGDFDAAEAQLREINARGGRDTWAYASLKMALSGTPSTY